MKQDQFNDEMWECAARFATWDIPHIKQQGANHFNSRPQPKLNDVGENYWLIDPSNCPENYGHNIIKLNGVFVNPKKVSVFFEGKAGIDGFRKISFRMQAGDSGLLHLQQTERGCTVILVRQTILLVRIPCTLKLRQNVKPLVSRVRCTQNACKTCMG